jgi:tRNA A-37 threonylcarbamoyl transferase component Bud32
MGVVYKARQIKANRLVALKMILSGEHAGPAELVRFQTEAEALARLQHPNIVQVHEVGECAGRPFFSLEFCDGGSLEKKLAGTPLASLEAAHLLELMAQAIHAAHQKDILHRDLKPSNVLLAEGAPLQVAVPKISDFGLAKKLNEAGQTASGAVMGTPSYMAPEQAAGKGNELGPATDVYALGAILYECLTGRPPFRSATVLDTIMQVISDEPVAPRQLNAKLPIDLETICLKCLHKEPAKRYQSAHALVEELRRFQEGRPITARPVGRIERGWRWCRRNPALAAALTLAVLFLVSGAAVSFAFGWNASLARDEAMTQTGLAETRLRAIEEKQKALLDALDQYEESAARSLLRPLGTLGAVALSDSEVEALWELTQWPEPNLRYRFVKEAVRGSMSRRAISIRQLRLRAGFAIHAAVGLDEDRRNRIEQMLVEAMEQPDLGPDQRVDLALTLVSLGRLSPRTAAPIARALTEASDGPALVALAEGLALVAGQLDASEAGSICALAAKTAPSTIARLALDFGGGLSRIVMVLSPYLNVQDAMLIATECNRLMAPMPGAYTVTELALCQAAAAARLNPKDAQAQCGAGATSIIHSLEIRTDREAEELVRGLSALMLYLDTKEIERCITLVVETMKKANPAHSFRALAMGLSALTARVEPARATVVCRPVAELLTGRFDKTTDLFMMLELARAVASLAGRLEPEDATALCGKSASALLQGIDKSEDRDRLEWSVQGVTVLAPWLDRKAVKEAIPVLNRTMKRVTFPEVQLNYSQTLSVLTGRLEPVESVTVLLEAMSSLIPDPLLHRPLIEGLSAGVSRLTPEQARTVAMAFFDILSKTLQEEARPLLLRSFLLVIPHMEPTEAVSAIAQAIGLSPDVETQEALSRGLQSQYFRFNPAQARQAAAALLQHYLRNRALAYAAAFSAVAPRLEAEEAARLCRQPVADVMKSLPGLTQPTAFRVSARLLAAFLPHLPAEEAANHSRQFAVLLIENLNKSTVEFFTQELAHGLAALGPSLEASDATMAAVALGKALGKIKAPLSQSVVGQALAAVTARLAPNVIEEHCGPALATLLLAMADPKNARFLPMFVPGVEALAVRLKSTDTTGTLLQAMNRTLEPARLKKFAQAIARISLHLTPKDASRVRVELVSAFARMLAGTTKDVDPGEIRTALLEALTDPAAARRHAEYVTLAVGVASVSSPGILQPAFQPTSWRSGNQELVEMLKSPLITGTARRLVLDQLEGRYDRKFADQWDFIRFAKEQKLDLDLTTPPRRLARADEANK